MSKTQYEKNAGRERVIPVYVLAGFLGSGKTTLLARLLRQAEAEGLKAAVVMNEIGDVNLDGLEVGEGIAMAEMLSGCICCTVRGDLGVEIMRLVDEHRPDVVYVECTGAANPLELLDGVTEASLLLRAELKGIVTVMDAAQLLAAHEKGKGQTYRLMKDQLRAASLIVLNKIDLISEEERIACHVLIEEWNGHARVLDTVRCEFDLCLVTSLNEPIAKGPEAEHDQHGHDHDHHDHQGHEHDHSHDLDQSHERSHRHAHHSHDHVMVYTHYMDGPVDSERFEQFMNELPNEIYRAKGILTFTDTSSRFMFQYAYRQLDCMRITPQREVPDVAVFIGEHFDREELRRRLEELEAHSAV